MRFANWMRPKVTASSQGGVQQIVCKFNSGPDVGETFPAGDGTLRVHGTFHLATCAGVRADTTEACMFNADYGRRILEEPPVALAAFGRIVSPLKFTEMFAATVKTISTGPSFCSDTTCPAESVP